MREEASETRNVRESVCHPSACENSSEVQMESGIQPCAARTHDDDDDDDENDLKVKELSQYIRR